MSLTAIVKAMVDSGCTPEQILAAVSAHQEEYDRKLAVKREQDAARQRRKRHAESRGVTRTERDTEQKRKEPKEKTKNSPKENPPKGGQKKRGSRLLDGWSPDEPIWQQMADELGVSHDQLEAEHRKFSDHWPAQPGQKGVKLDWVRTWKNWMRNARFPPAKANGTGVMIRKGSKQWDAWRQHARKVNDERLLASMKYTANDGQMQFKAEWPSQAF